MMEYIISRMPQDVLRHYGVKGMKWGVRNYQNKDGTLTELGKSRLREKRKNAKAAAAYESLRRLSSLKVFSVTFSLALISSIASLQSSP